MRDLLEPGKLKMVGHPVKYLKYGSGKFCRYGSKKIFPGRASTSRRTLRVAWTLLVAFFLVLSNKTFHNELYASFTSSDKAFVHSYYLLCNLASLSTSITRINPQFSTCTAFCFSIFAKVLGRPRSAGQQHSLSFCGLIRALMCLGSLSK